MSNSHLDNIYFCNYLAHYLFLQEKFSKELKKIAFCQICRGNTQHTVPKKSSSQNKEEIAMVTINASPRHFLVLQKSWILMDKVKIQFMFYLIISYFPDFNYLILTTWLMVTYIPATKIAFVWRHVSRFSLLLLRIESLCLKLVVNVFKDKFLIDSWHAYVSFLECFWCEGSLLSSTYLLSRKSASMHILCNSTWLNYYYYHNRLHQWLSIFTSHKENFVIL